MVVWAAVCGMIFGAMAESAHAQSDFLIDLSKETQQEVRVAVTEYVPLNPEADEEVGRLSRDILENDLKLFEIFLPVARDVYADLEKDENSQMRVNFPSWNQRGVQWLIKAEFKMSAGQDKIKLVFRLYDVINERFLMGKRYQGTRKFLRKMTHRFADEVMMELTGKRGVAETRIAFLSRSKKGKEIYAIDFDGAQAKKLTDERAVVLSPDWSPNGRSIVYTSYKDHNPDLIMVDDKGRKRRPLLKLPGLNSAPAWSPDGNMISLVLSRDRNSEIYVLNRWRKLVRLTRHFNIDTSPTWSPDGEKIAFTSDRSGTGRPQIYIMDAQSGDRKGVQRITFDSSYNDNAAWSPNGDMIAYTSLVNGKFQIKVYNLETRDTLTLTEGPRNKEEPTWSPDGRYLAFRVSQGRASAIHIQRVEGTRSRQLTFLSKGGFSPTWSPYSKR